MCVPRTSWECCSHRNAGKQGGGDAGGAWQGHAVPGCAGRPGHTWDQHQAPSAGLQPALGGDRTPQQLQPRCWSHCVQGAASRWQRRAASWGCLRLLPGETPTCSSLRFGAAQGADPAPGPFFFSLGPRPGGASGRMFSPTGCRRGFPRQPGPWQVGPSPPRPYGPHNTWDEMPQHRRSRGQWCRPWFSEPTPFPGPDDFYGNEENRRWGPRDGLPPPHWDNEECDQRPEICSEEGWYPPWSCDPRPFPGPADYYGNEEYWGWAPNDWSAPCFWGARDDEGPEECFREGWHPEMMPPHPNCSTWPEFPNEGQHPPWPPAHQTGERDGFQDDFRPWGFRGPARRPFQRVRRGHRKSTMVMRPPPFRPRGYRPPPQSSPSSGMSQPVAKEEPQTLTPIKADVQSREPQAKDLPAASQKVPKCPGATDTSQKSLATDPPVATEAVKPEQAAGATLVEPCSQSSPEAGAGSYPCSPTAPPEPAEPPQGQQCRAEATSAGVPPGGPTEPKVQPKEASSYTCIKSETSPGTQHPPASSEVKPAAGGSQQLCSGLPQPSSASRDLRSAAVLARKEKIELSYQQFSLTIAVVATMLLQKEPSMEAALGLALRANLRQGRIHHLQELEDFINSYDLATPSH